MKNTGYIKAKRFFAIVLTAVMLISAIPCSSYAVSNVITDENERLQYLINFNESVNAIKSGKPEFVYVKEVGLSDEEPLQTDYNGKYASELSESGRKYLKVLLDAVFNPEKGIIKNLFNAISGEENDLTVREIPKGVDSKNVIPLKGKNVVSELSVADDYDIIKETHETQDKKSYDIVRFVFKNPEAENPDEASRNIPLEIAKKSSVARLIDLPSGTFDPVIISGELMPEEDPEHPLSKVKLEDFTVSAYADAIYADKGELLKYTQTISYTFSISFYDAMKILEAYTNIDVLQIGLAIANPILKNTGNPEVEAKDILKNTSMLVQYNINIEIGKFNWEPRFFGDSDNNGRVDAYDARRILRHSVNIDKMESQSDLVYSDIDFDGKITAADARLALRMSVKLEKLFDEVPQGKKILIVQFPAKPEKPEKPEEPGIPVEPDKPVKPEKPDKPDRPDSDEISKYLGDLTNGIFDIINGIMGDGVTDEGMINDLVKQIQEIIAHARK